MSLSVDISFTNVAILISLYFLAKIGFSVFKKWSDAKKLSRWDAPSRNKVIMHGIPRSITIPDASPYVLKLETYLRAAKIPFELDVTDPFSVQGKTPWLSYNGQHVADSHFCIEFLKKKFEPIRDPYTDAERGIARAFRILLETHFLWGFARWRWDVGFKHITKVFPLSTFEKLMYGFLISRSIRTSAWHHGIGRHSIEDQDRLAEDDLRSVSAFLGNKKYILGDVVCEEDFAIFGMLANVVWAAPESPLERLVKTELPNIVEYCNRMQNDYWKDWNECLAVPK